MAARRTVRREVREGLVQDIPVPVRPPYTHSTLFLLEVPAEEGQIILVQAQYQCTNPHNNNVMLCQYLAWSTENTIHREVYDLRWTHGSYIIPCTPAGENITPGMGNGYRALSGSFVAPHTGTFYISLIIYAASSASQGWRVPIPQHYGGLV